LSKSSPNKMDKILAKGASICSKEAGPIMPKTAEMLTTLIKATSAVPRTVARGTFFCGLVGNLISQLFAKQA
jgi:hypothetical protein